MGSEASRAAAAENPVTTARVKVIQQTDEIRDIRREVERIGDVVFGPSVGNPVGTPDQPPRCGEAGMLHDALDEQAGAISDLRFAVRRIAELGIDPGPNDCHTPAVANVRR